MKGPTKEELVQRLIEDPTDVKTLYNLGLSVADEGMLERGIHFVSQAMASDRKTPIMACGLGRLLLQSCQYHEAACAFRQALALVPNSPIALNGLGVAFLLQGETPLAVACFRRAIKEASDASGYHANLARGLNQAGEYYEAISVSNTAIGLEPGNTSAYFQLANALINLGDFNTAIAALLELIQRQPGHTEAYHLIAMALIAQNRLEESFEYSTKALAIDPDHPLSHFGLAWFFLATGDFQNGWREYEWRFKVPGQDIDRIRFINPLTEPMWNGENLNGKSLLIWGEQGFGDTIQFARFVPELHKRGCKILLLLPLVIAPLFRLLPYVEDVVVFGKPIPRFDYHIALCSIPRILNVSLEQVTYPVPYLVVPTNIQHLPVFEKIPKLRIGFVNSTVRKGMFDHRNVPLRHFETLFELPDIEFYSFQILPEKEEKDTVKHYANVHQLGSIIKSFTDSAHLISKMDLVISIDTALAHLAGALGVRVWLMLQSSAEWRWLSRDSNMRWNEQTPWYPTMELFRAPSFNYWEPVMARMKQKLIQHF